MSPHIERFRRMAEAYGKPIALGECGCTSSAGGAQHPSGWTSEASYDGEEQANYLEAIIRCFSPEPWWNGIYWWKWDEQNKRPQFLNDPAGDKGFTVLGKPAEERMQKLYGELNQHTKPAWQGDLQAMRPTASEERFQD